MWKLFANICLLLLARRAEGLTYHDKDRSYVLYEQWDAKRYGELKFKFKTHQGQGLIVYSDNSKSKTSPYPSFIKVELKYGKLKMTVQMGNNDYMSRKDVTIGKNLNDLEWHQVVITRIDLTTLIRLDDLEESIVLNPRSDIATLELNSGVYIGGVDNAFAKGDIIDASLGNFLRFIGCIDDFGYRSSRYNRNWPKFHATITKSEAVGKERCADRCRTATCLNGGRCVNMFSTTRCNCLGTGFSATNCTRPKQSIRLSGDGYISINLPAQYKTTERNSIVIRFKTHQADGVLMAGLNKDDHILIELWKKTIRVSFDVGSGHNNILTVADRAFNDGRWHVIDIQRKTNNYTLTVDSKYVRNSVTPGKFQKFNLNEGLYVGGHPEHAELAKANSFSKTNFNGCLQEVHFSGLDILFKTMNIRSSRFEKHGDIKKGCDVQETRGISDRDTGSIQGIGVGISNEMEPTPYLSMTTPVKSSDNGVSGLKSSARLTKRQIIWIIVGIILGSIALIIVLILIVNNFKKRYTGVLLPKYPHNGANNNVLHKRKSSQETVVYTPNNVSLLRPQIV